MINLEMNHCKGLIPAVFTPFQANGEVNVQMVKKQAYLLKSGVSGVFVSGTTGEGLLQTVHERMRLAEVWRNEVGEQSTCIVHVGHHCLVDGKQLAKHAQDIGADAIAAIGPVFYKVNGVSELVDYCAEIAAAPRLPFYYYHIPSMSGIHVSIFEFLREASRRIPIWAGQSLHTKI
jgi:N-acetylneuraminate lyase